MDRDLPLIPTFIFIASLLGCLWVYMSTTPNILPRPVAQITQDSSKQNWALYRQWLIPIGSTADTIEPLSMQAWGINDHLGQVIPLQYGGWIINSGGQNTSLWHNIKRFLRLRENDNQSDSGSLLKCDQQLFECHPWGDPKLHFNTAWSGIELANRRLLINDTARHQVHLVSEQGSVLSTLDKFYFPNHVALAQGHYWVVDTNRNRLAKLSIQTDQLALSGETIDLAGYEDINPLLEFPSIAEYDGVHWWVLSNDNGMANGYIYRLKDQRAQRFSTATKDPTAFMLDDNLLLVADFKTQKIRQINLQNKRQETLQLPALEEKIEQTKQAIAKAKQSMWSTIFIILGIGFAALIFAIVRSKPAKQRSEWFTPNMIRINHATRSDAVVTEELTWIEKNPIGIRKFRTAVLALRYIGFACILMVALLGLSYPALFVNAASIFSLLITSFLAIIAASFLHSKYVLDGRIGVRGDKVVYQLPGENKQLFRAKDISYSKNGMLAKGQYLFWQNQQLVVYDKTQFEQLAAPIIRLGQSVSPIKLYILRLQAKEGSAIVETIMCAVLVSCIAYLGLTGQLN